jgi:hypothetical protein
MNRLASLAALAATAATAALAAAAPVHAAPAEPPVPGGDIAVTGDHDLFLIGHAEGVQIYRCDGSAWTLLAPRATLYGDNGKVVATHSGGPTWEARDGSTVVGRRVASAPSPDPAAIPWLKLEAAFTTVGVDGDRFASVSFIQRYNTSGGTAPSASTCDAGHAGTVNEVPYTADYAFWR